MYLSARQAAAVLGEAELARSQARRVLATGLAGLPMKSSSGHLYEASRVQELADRRWLTSDEVADACPGRLFVARRPVDVTVPLAEQLDSLSSGWDIGVGTWLELLVVTRTEGPVPLVATTGGFVLLGAEIVRCQPLSANHRGSLSLREPGQWFAAFRDRRLHTGPGRDFALLGGVGTRAPGVASRGPVAGEPMGGSTHPTPEENA